MSDDQAREDFGLTPRDLQIVSAVVAGYTNKEIAEHLRFNVNNVRRYLFTIFGKLGVSSRMELAVFAVGHVRWADLREAVDLLCAHAVLVKDERPDATELLTRAAQYLINEWKAIYETAEQRSRK
jgi:DNA-binding CsgD family transcriptional regulator